jgi:hypothetical protein
MSVHATSPAFRENARAALADQQLQKALGNVRQNFIARRAAAAPMHGASCGGSHRGCWRFSCSAWSRSRRG